MGPQHPMTHGLWNMKVKVDGETMMGIETPERGQWIRVISLELQRIASHLMWLASYGPDLGLLTGLLWCLRERELFLDLIQLMSGARMGSAPSPPSMRSTGASPARTCGRAA